LSKHFSKSTNAQYIYLLHESVLAIIE